VSGAQQRRVTRDTHTEINDMNQTDPAPSAGSAEQAGVLYAELTWSRRYAWRLRVIDPQQPGDGTRDSWLLGFTQHDEQAAHVHAMASLEEHGWSPARAFEEYDRGSTWMVPVTAKEPAP
jgi:hypothetical protein